MENVIYIECLDYSVEKEFQVYSIYLAIYRQYITILHGKITSINTV